jgi:acid phosphatase
MMQDRVPPEHRRTHELLNSVLWTQTAAEFQVLAKQSYIRAQEALDEALEDTSWTAALEQEGLYDMRPPAVILDVDETVLDNSPYEARLIQREAMFSTDTWHQWCQEARAPAIPGALEFTRYAASKAVTVFYVTNRRHEVEEATRKNLEALGFPLDSRRDTLLTRGERREWDTSDKTPRRKEVASRHRVLLLIGDNLGDFVPIDGLTVDQRAKLVEQYPDYWGKRWIMLPNPQYGSWEGALYGFEYGLSDEEKLRIKYEKLKTK